MASKNQIANRMYGDNFEYLSAAQKAAVTRAFNAQAPRAEPTPAREARVSASSDADGVEVEFGRPGVNGVKKVIAASGATSEQAFEQTGLTMNPKKEGFVVKRSTKYSAGHVLKFNDPVYNGDLIMIVPGIDSSAQ